MGFFGGGVKTHTHAYTHPTISTVAKFPVCITTLKDDEFINLILNTTFVELAVYLSWLFLTCFVLKDNDFYKCSRNLEKVKEQGVCHKIQNIERTTFNSTLHKIYITDKSFVKKLKRKCCHQRFDDVSIQFIKRKISETDSAA